MSNFDKVILNGTTYTIPSGGGGNYDYETEGLTIASALVELHNDKADKNQLHNYQLKGDYATRTEVTEGLSLKANVTALSDYRTEAEAINVEKVDAAALNDLDSRIAELNSKINALERTVFDLQSSVGAINARTQNVITTTETQLFGEAVVDAGGFTGLDATDSATALAELGYQPQE